MAYRAQILSWPHLPLALLASSPFQMHSQTAPFGAIKSATRECQEAESTSTALNASRIGFWHKRLSSLAPHRVPSLPVHLPRTPSLDFHPPSILVPPAVPREKFYNRAGTKVQTEEPKTFRQVVGSMLINCLGFNPRPDAVGFYAKIIFQKGRVKVVNNIVDYEYAL